MCAYYLGKNTSGDLSKILTGAYNLSSDTKTGTGTTPINPNTSVNLYSPTGSTFQTSTTTDRAKECRARCDPYDDGTQEGRKARGICMDNCMAAGGEGPGGENQQECDETHPCPTGQKCVNGKCKPSVPSGCTEGKECAGNQDCGTGTCVKPTPIAGGAGTGQGKCKCGANCPDGSGPAYAKNPTACPCGIGWASLTGKCPTGYTAVTQHRSKDDWGASDIPYKEGAIATCECTQAIADWREGNQGLGEYKYPPEMQELMKLLLGRSKEFLGMPLGYSQDAIDAMFGKGFEGIRGQERGEREGLSKLLQSQGMTGTGTESKLVNDLSWTKEKNITDIARDIMIGNEVQKKKDVVDFSTMAQSLFGTGMSYEQILEAINSSRRGEANAALMALLQLFLGMNRAA